MEIRINSNDFLSLEDRQIARYNALGVAAGFLRGSGSALDWAGFLIEQASRLWKQEVVMELPLPRRKAVLRIAVSPPMYVGCVFQGIPCASSLSTAAVVGHRAIQSLKECYSAIPSQKEDARWAAPVHLWNLACEVRTLFKDWESGIVLPLFPNLEGGLPLTRKVMTQEEQIVKIENLNLKDPFAILSALNTTVAEYCAAKTPEDACKIVKSAHHKVARLTHPDRTRFSESRSRAMGIENLNNEKDSMCGYNSSDKYLYVCGFQALLRFFQ